jgi:hypothetical protein
MRASELPGENKKGNKKDKKEQKRQKTGIIGHFFLFAFLAAFCLFVSISLIDI